MPVLILTCSSNRSLKSCYNVSLDRRYPTLLVSLHDHLRHFSQRASRQTDRGFRHHGYNKKKRHSMVQQKSQEKVLQYVLYCTISAHYNCILTTITSQCLQKYEHNLKEKAYLGIFPSLSTCDIIL